VTRTETDEETGEEQDRDIPFLKGYTVFNVEQTRWWARCRTLMS
jgi:antirestriction protein ArdC